MILQEEVRFVTWLDEIARNALAYLCVAAAGAIVVVLMFAAGKRPRVESLPSTLLRLARLGGLEVGCTFLFMLIIPRIIRDLLETVGFFAWQFEDSPSDNRKDLYVGILFLPLLLATIHMILRRRAGVSLVHL